ncbi:MAG: glycosyltransferase family 2 protein [Planctomycetota bacterium]
MDLNAKPSVSCVISVWNNRDFLRGNLWALRQQTYAPAEIIVVDNHSEDGTAEMVRDEFPEVRLIRMPHSRFGACETFNVGFKAASGEYTAIMDDDVIAPPTWIERIMLQFEREPPSTAMVSSKVLEPGMPQEYIDHPEVNRIRYMATFRGCGTVARADVLRRAGYYDEKFFIYGNERDLAARVLNLGYRILQYPPAALFHGTPFGLKSGQRSLYYHVRNFWLYAFKNCSWPQVIHAAMLLVGKGLGVGQRKPLSDAVGVIGIERTIKETPGGLRIALKASFNALRLLPYCLKHRHVCRSPDFRPPLG